MPGLTPVLPKFSFDGNVTRRHDPCFIHTSRQDMMGSYLQAGVNIDNGNELVSRLKRQCPHIGGFSGLYPLGEDFLVASTDGVGTKLKLAFDMGRHETIGIDLVAMCVNDIITTGARPLFLLDYFATSQLDVDQAEKVLQGVLLGCQESNCILLGGETAEMPGFYKAGEYDIAGFVVGIVKKSKLIDGRAIKEGDMLVGVSSTGVHSNGFSLVRHIVERAGASLDQPFESTGMSLGEVLLQPTQIYVRQVQSMTARYTIKGISHITGGGLIENVPRMLPEGLSALIRRGCWGVPPIFSWLQEKGGVDAEEMYRVFNMGVGLVLVVERSEAAEICQREQNCHLIGEIVRGDNAVIWN